MQVVISLDKVRDFKKSLKIQTKEKPDTCTPCCKLFMEAGHKIYQLRFLFCGPLKILASCLLGIYREHAQSSSLSKWNKLFYPAC